MYNYRRESIGLRFTIMTIILAGNTLCYTRLRRVLTTVRADKRNRGVGGMGEATKSAASRQGGTGVHLNKKRVSDSQIF